MASTSPIPLAHPLASFLREQKDAIVSAFAARVRTLSPAKDLSRSALIDHVPVLLERMADIVDTAAARVDSSLSAVGKVHAADRLSRGFELSDVISEFGFLRGAILDRWQRDGHAALEVKDMRALDTAFDAALRHAANEYAALRLRILRSVNALSEAAFSSGDLDAFLGNLIRIAVDSMQDVATAAILIREGHELHLRAAYGLEGKIERTFTCRVGEGFSGRVASLARPLDLRHAAIDPTLLPPALQGAGLRALYGVPLIRGDEVVGVASIGSLTADEFSEDDKLLFRTMASRAASVISKTRLMAKTERAAAIQGFLATVSRQLHESLDYEALLARISHLAVPVIADWCVVDLVVDSGLKRVSVAHVDPAKEEHVRHLERRYPVDLNSPRGVPKVLRTGEPEIGAEITDAMLAAAARDAEHLGLLRELRLSSYIIAPMLSRGRVIGALSLVMAESGRKYDAGDVDVAMDLARRMATAIENARLYAMANAAIHTREQVLAVVSHDIRNHLAVLRTATQVLARTAEGSPGATSAPVEMIERAVSTMRRLVGDLLDMAAIQAGRIAIDSRAIDLGGVVRDVCEPMLGVAEAQRVRLECAVVHDGVLVHADRDRIMQVLANLLGNAIKFSRAGDSVRLEVEEREDDVLLSVIDTGPGIPAQELQRLFEPYQSVARSGARGTGLGLYISRGIVERHGGRIWCESVPGRGSAFRFTLPRAARQAAKS